MKYKFFAKSVKVAEATDRILETAERIGMVLPSTHTALFQSVYSPIEEANDNGVRLAKGATDKALPGIIGAQANLEHLGKNWMVGMILDAWINSNNEIEIIYSFAKNIFEEEYISALEQMNNKQLAVSFELLADVEAQERLSDGTIRLNDFDFQGVGVLIDETPAYKKALTYEVANKYKDRVTKYQKELVFAKEIVKTCDDVLAQGEDEFIPFEELLWTTITTRVDRHIHVMKINFDGDGESVGTFGDDEDPHVHKVVNYQVQAKAGHAHRLIEELMAKRKEAIKDVSAIKNPDRLKEKDISKTKQGGITTMTDEQKKVIADLREEFGDHAKDISDDDLLNEAKVEEIRKAKKDSEAKAKNKEKPTDLEKANTRIAELEAENAEMKATIEAKDSEIEEVRTNAEKIGKLKVEFKDNKYVADFKDEDYLDEGKVERARMQKENDDLKAQNEALAKDVKEAKEKVQASKKKGSKESKEEKDEDLPTGHEDEDENSDTPSTLIAKLNKDEK